MFIKLFQIVFEWFSSEQAEWTHSWWVNSLMEPSVISLCSNETILKAR